MPSLNTAAPVLACRPDPPRSQEVRVLYGALQFGVAWPYRQRWLTASPDVDLHDWAWFKAQAEDAANRANRISAVLIIAGAALLWRCFA